MRLSRAALLLIVLLAALAGPAQATTHRVVINGLFFYKPHEIPISGDGDFVVVNLRWHSWGGRTAVATGQAIEQLHPSHVNHIYPVRVTLSRRTACANLHRRVYNEVGAQILGPNPGVFGERTLGRRYTCSGSWSLITPPPSHSALSRHVAIAHSLSRHVAIAHRCSTHGMPLAVVTIDARDCARGRTVVREWFHRLKTPGGNRCVVPDGSYRPAVCMVRNWRCTSTHTVNGQTYPVTCTADRGRRRVHFVNRV